LTGLRILPIVYSCIKNWVDAQANLPIPARWIAKADVAPIRGNQWNASTSLYGGFYMSTDSPTPVPPTGNECQLIYLRLERLRRDVASLPVDEIYRARLYRSIDLYADQILARPPDPPPPDYWSDLEALQQVTLGDRVEEMLDEMCNKRPER
jgi:hypothetical protein